MNPDKLEHFYELVSVTKLTATLSTLNRVSYYEKPEAVGRILPSAVACKLNVQLATAVVKRGLFWSYKTRIISIGKLNH